MKFSPKCRVLCLELKQDRRAEGEQKSARGAAQYRASWSTAVMLCYSDYQTISSDLGITILKTFEPAHNKTYDLCDQRRLRSACTCVQSDQSSLIACAFYSLQAIQREINESPCPTGLIHRLIWVFAGHTGFTVGFVMRWLICQGIIAAVFTLHSWTDRQTV